jgi:hypothetical protein
MSDDIKSDVVEDKKIDVKVENAELDKLSDEDIKWRAKYKLTKSEYEEEKIKAAQDKAVLESKVSASLKERQMLEKKVLDAELKAHAVAAGLRDLDFVQLIDTKDLKMNESGNIEGLEKAVADFKARKPDLFAVEKKASSSTNAGVAATAATGGRIDARSLSKDDWRKNKTKYMSGNFS